MSSEHGTKQLESDSEPLKSCSESKSSSKKNVSKNKKKRIMQERKSIEKYIARMKTKPKSFFLPLAQAYLSTYRIYSTVHNLSQCSKFIKESVFAVHLMEYTRSLGIDVKGVTSEHKKDDKFICKERADPDNKIIYVGKFAYFSGAEASEYAPSKEDMEYASDDSSSELVYAEHL